MKYFAECNATGRMLPYHPDPRIKSDTVTLLEPPAEEQPKPEKPHHEGHSIEWSSTDCAKMLLGSFIKMNQMRSIEEMQSVLTAFDELATDFINERDEINE